MTLKKLVEILQATGYPVAYSHFDDFPSIPFICYHEVFSSNVHADNWTYYPVKNFEVELYTDKKDLEAESALETVLNANELPYETDEYYIESERIYQKIYYIAVL
jgi:hypothetical protein